MALPRSESRTGERVGKVNPVAVRWLMWVDGVGGFLLLPGDDWTIGGPSGADESEICIQGDLAGRAACLRRQQADYVLQPFAATLLGGRRMHRPTLLRDGDRITLGPPTEPPLAPAATGGVQLAFAKPHPLSASARLTVVSRHRVRPRCDAVILFADTCVLGPSRSSHVYAPGAAGEIVLLFDAGRLWCRGDGETTIDGRLQESRFEVVPGARVESAGLAFSLEPL